MDKWDMEMKKRKEEHNTLIRLLEDELLNVNRNDDTSAENVRKAAEKLIENSIGQKNMYR